MNGREFRKYDIDQLRSQVSSLAALNDKNASELGEKEGLLCQLLREIDELKAVIRDVPTEFYADTNKKFDEIAIYCDMGGEISAYIDFSDIELSEAEFEEGGKYKAYHYGKRAREFELKHQNILRKVRGDITPKEG